MSLPGDSPPAAIPQVSSGVLTHSATIGKLALAVSQAQSKLRNPERNRTVTVRTRTGGEYGFRYATLDAILALVRPVLAEAKIALVQGVRTNGKGLQTEESVRFVFMEHLDSVGVLFVVKDKHLFTDQGDGSLIELAVQGNGAVFGHSASCALAEVILEIFGGGSEAMHLSGKALKSALAGGGVFSLVVEIEPEIKGFIEIVQGLSSKP